MDGYLKTWVAAFDTAKCDTQNAALEQRLGMIAIGEAAVCTVPSSLNDPKGELQSDSPLLESPAPFP
jgi:hypothetical protein